ncbi:MAG: radical SAM protein [Promethearchaeati archaeon SRVP18_Atabeyarchaeia-1]
MWRIVRPDSLEVWGNELVRSRLSRYYGILKGIFLPKFKLTKLIPVSVSMDSSEEVLWSEHRRVSRIFNELLKDLDEGKSSPADIEAPLRSTYLDLKIELGRRIAQNCHLCERRCGINRLKDEKGFCRVGRQALVSTSFLHMGEESVLVPSGTIFLSGCNFGPCVFCQNHDISGDPDNGKAVSPLNLADMASALKKEGARNINWVGGSPTPNLHNIVESMKYLEVDICQLWNSNFYMSTESMELLLDLFDFWLPDMKWYGDECALKYSRVPNYWSVVSSNHTAVHDRGGGEMIVRHLVMPGHVECCSKPILGWISKNLPKALVNVMAQYHPAYLVPSNKEFIEINRRPSQDEVQEAHKYADQLGLLWRPVS